MRKLAVVLMSLAAPGLAHAAVDCPTATVPQATPLRPTILAPISTELATSSYQLGTQVSVLSHAYDESQSVDQVLLRLRIEGCQNVAIAMPAPTAIDPNDPAVYKPKTEFDNTPWRFDMSQNGERMTADAFSAWMKARGVRIAKGAPPAVPVATAAAATQPASPGMNADAAGSDAVAAGESATEDAASPNAQAPEADEQAAPQPAPPGLAPEVAVPEASDPAKPETAAPAPTEATPAEEAAEESEQSTTP